MHSSEAPSISKEPLSILFNPRMVAKKNVWDIDLLEVLGMMARVLERSGEKDLRIAGIAALSSSLIYRMKVESIFALQREAMDKRPPPKRTSMDIETIQMPYRHQSTYAVSLDDLMGLLQNLVVSIANPRSQRSRRFTLEPVPVPDIRDHMLSLERIIGRYQDLIMRKISGSGRGSLQEIISGLDQTDSIRCFFAALFLAKEEKVTLEQDGEDVAIIVVSAS